MTPTVDKDKAKQAYKVGQDANEYARFNETARRAYWSYGVSQGLIDVNRLNPQARAEYQKYSDSSLSYVPEAAGVKPGMKAVKDDMSLTGYSFQPTTIETGGKAYDRFSTMKPYNSVSIDEQPKRIGGRSLEDMEGNVAKPKTALIGNIMPREVEVGNTPNPLKPIGNLALNTLNTINSVVQAPATVGKYGTEEMNKAKAEGKNPVGGLLKGYGIGLGKAITGQDAVSNTEVIEGIAPKTTTALKEKYPGAYKLASDIANMVDITDLTALGILGDLAKVQKLGKLPDTTKTLIKANAQNLAEISIKKKAGEVLTGDEQKLVDAVRTDIDDYYDTIGYYDEAYRSDPKYIKNEIPLRKTDIAEQRFVKQNAEVDGKAVNQQADILPQGITKINQAVITPPLPPKSQMTFDEFKQLAKKRRSISGNGEYAIYFNGKQLTQFDSPSYEKAYQDYLKTIPAKTLNTESKLTKLDALQGSTTEAKIGGNINPLPIAKPLDTVATGTPQKTIKEVVETAQGKKDISGFQAYTTDVYRNFEQVFKEDYPAVKKEVLDPFDAAKKSKTVEDRQLMTNLKKNIVDKFNIQKGSKDSALVQQFGEKRISEAELIAKVGKAKATNIVEADKWFRSEYDRLIDEVNAAREIVYPNNPEKLIPHRTDYYRHFKELSDDFAGLKNIFETPSQISPSLAGTSEFTKPKSKFLSFAQKRGNGEFTDDAVGGFLDYINAATYAKHIDTQIPKFRALASDLAESTEQSKNLNNFIGYLTDFANDLSGKTNPADRFVQKIIPGGRTTFKAINWLNNRVKANTILGNVSSSLSQIANIPQGIAYVKDPVQLSKGAGNYLGSIFGKGDAALYNKSGFLLERYADNVARQFDVKILDQPKKAAAWMLGALDEVGTKFIWSSTYQKALADGVKEPIKYADDITRKLVAGRGIGEVPLLQKSKIMQLVAPFTIEVNNLWKVQKDFIKAKDFGGLALLYLANFTLNKGMEEVRGDGVVFDPIQAIYDASTEKDLKPIERAGRLGGEVLSNMPLGSTLATLYPEYGVSNDLIDLPTREKLFGRNDPTRFGGGLLAVKGLQDPLYKVAPSFGGGQIKKTVQAGQDLGLLPKLKKQEGKILPKLEKQDIPASYSNTRQGDRMRTTIDPKLSTIAKGLAFGRGAIPEVKEYYESGKVPLGVKQTENIKKLIDKGYDQNKLFKTLNGIRGINKKADIVVKLRESGYNSKEIAEIWEIFYK